MLKSLQSVHIGNQLNTKCGEIFCQGATTNFTIICNFCEIKAFEFDDFLLHFRNVHFENNLLKTEAVNVDCTPVLALQIKNEVEKTEIAEDGNEPTRASLAFMEASGTINWENSESSSCNENDEEWKSEMNNDHESDDGEYILKTLPPPAETKKFECDQCKKQYKSEAILKHHIRKYHNEIDGHQCAECSQMFPNLRQFNAHMTNIHMGFRCSQCDKKFSTKYDLHKHEVIHTGIKDFVCDFENCGKSFYTRRRLTIHRHIHNEAKNFVCESCGYSCRIKEMLKVHYRTHTGEKPYACDMCDKRFASASMLKEHKPIHSTERPHVCDVCGATFSRPKALYHHKNLHSGIKKYKCKLCDNAYAQASGLAGHMRQHKMSMMIMP